jgi:acyl dehydratase
MPSVGTEIGQKYRSSSYTIGESNLSWFAALSLDFARLHTDATYAARSIFGQRVGHGLLGMCMAEGLLNREGAAAVSFSWEWEFVAPFFIGDTIFAEATISAREKVALVTIVVEEIEVFKNDGVLIQRGRRKQASGEAGDDWLLAALRPAADGFEFLKFEADNDIPSSTADPDSANETGVFFDDLQSGDCFATCGYTINEMHAGMFASMMGDTSSWLYGDGFDYDGTKRQLVHPILGLALVEGLKNMLAPDAGVGTPMASLSWRWQQIAPIFIGDTLHLDVRIDGRRASRTKTDRGVIAQSIALVSAGRGVVQGGQHVQMLRRRPP